MELSENFDKYITCKHISFTNSRRWHTEFIYAYDNPIKLLFLADFMFTEKLTNNNLPNLFSCLYDYSGTRSGYVVKINKPFLFEGMTF